MSINNNLSARIGFPKTYLGLSCFTYFQNILLWHKRLICKCILCTYKKFGQCTSKLILNVLNVEFSKLDKIFHILPKHGDTIIKTNKKNC